MFFSGGLFPSWHWLYNMKQYCSYSGQPTEREKNSCLMAKQLLRSELKRKGKHDCLIWGFGVSLNVRLMSAIFWVSNPLQPMWQRGVRKMKEATSFLGQKEQVAEQKVHTKHVMRHCVLGDDVKGWDLSCWSCTKFNSHLHTHKSWLIHPNGELASSPRIIHVWWMNSVKKMRPYIKPLSPIMPCFPIASLLPSALFMVRCHIFSKSPSLGDSPFCKIHM